MLEIKITAAELSEAINNLARAVNLAAATPVGMTTGAARTNTTYATVEETTPASVTALQTPAAPAKAEVNNITAAAAASVPVVTAAPAVPTAAPQYTLEMIAKAGTALIDAGKMNELTALLSKYGVEALTALDPAYYGAFAAELRAMGAQI